MCRGAPVSAALTPPTLSAAAGPSFTSAPQICNRIGFYRRRSGAYYRPCPWQ